MASRQRRRGIKEGLAVPVPAGNGKTGGRLHGQEPGLDRLEERGSVPGASLEQVLP